MTSCVNPNVADFCPTQAQLQPQMLALLPRGRAWGEGGPGREPGGVIYQFWWAVSGMFAWIHQQICFMALEFVCQTANFTLPLWMREYGLPDYCDPFPNLCAKVAAQGGVTCAYYQAVAAAIGWSVTCGEGCGLGVGCITTGPNQVVGPLEPLATLVIIVDLPLSPAYDGIVFPGVTTGCYRAGQPPMCGPDIRSLECVMTRIVGAHLQLIFAFVPVTGQPYANFAGGATAAGALAHAAHADTALFAGGLTASNVGSLSAGL